MKFSELMLDYATGDACKQDAYIQEALGQINVSKAIYEAAVEITDLDADEIAYIQEAATAAGIPTDRNEAFALAKEGFSRSANGFMNLLKQSTSKVADAADKSWKAICGASRMVGVPDDVRSQGLEDFAVATAKGIVNKAYSDETAMSQGFKDGTSLRTNAGLYMKGIQDILPSFGLKGNMNNSVVTEYVAMSDTDYSKSDLNKFIITMEYATAALGNSKVAPAYDATVTDIADYIRTAYTLKTFCESVTDALDSDSTKKSASAYAAKFAGNGERSQYAMEQMQTSANRIAAATDALASSLNDSGYAIGESLNGGIAPLPQLREE